MFQCLSASMEIILAIWWISPKWWGGGCNPVMVVVDWQYQCECGENDDVALQKPGMAPSVLQDYGL